MKTRNLVILGVATILVLGSAYALAGPGKGGAGFGMRGECTGDGPGPLGGFGLMGRALRHLDLSQEQRDAIRAILEAERDAVQALRQQLRANRQAFRDAHPPSEFNEAAVRAHAEAQGKIHTELAVAAARTRAKALAVLTPEQLVELGELRARFEERWGGRGRGLQGMGGGRGK